MTAQASTVQASIIKTSRPDIVILHQHFRWAEGGGPARTHYLGRALMAAGYSVIVVTGPEVSVAGDLDIRHVGLPYNANMGFGARIVSFMAYVVAAWWVTIKLRPKLIYASSTPLTVGLIAICSFRPFIFEVRDLWPQAPIELKALRNPLLIRLAYWIANTSYRMAKAIVVLSPPMLEVVKPFNNRVVVVPNFAKPEWADHIEGIIADRINTQALPRPYTLYYGGAVGPANGVDKIIRIAKALATDTDSKWQVCLAPELGRVIDTELQQAIDLGYIQLVPYLNEADLRHYLTKVQAMLVSFADLPTLETTSPNKLFLGLSMGLPMVMACQGWHTDLIVAQQAGFWVAPDMDDEAIQAEFKAMEQPEGYEQMSIAAWQLSHQFSTQTAQKKVVDLVRSIFETLSYSKLKD